MTPTEITALRAKVFLDAPAAALLAAGDSAGLRAYLNTATTAIAWKTSVSIDEIMRNGMDWARVDNLSVGKARIWDWLGRLGSFDASKPNVRAGIDATWVGTAPDLAVRAQVYTHCKRVMTRAEQMLSTGLGTDASPSSMSFEGEVSDLDTARLIFKDNGTIWTPGG